jgi:guanylate kinase
VGGFPAHAFIFEQSHLRRKKDHHDHHRFSGSLFIVAAPSGAGKSTLVNALLAQEPGIKLSISTTTRPPRPGEQDGREYHFTTADDFVARADRGEFLEWAEVHGNYYGTSRLMVEKEMKAGTDILLEIDWQGARQVKKQFPDAAGIFILPPSIAAGRAPAQARPGRTAHHHAAFAGRRRRDRSRSRVRVCYYQ